MSQGRPARNSCTPSSAATISAMPTSGWLSSSTTTRRAQQQGRQRVAQARRLRQQAGDHDDQRGLDELARLHDDRAERQTSASRP